MRCMTALRAMSLAALTVSLIALCAHAGFAQAVRTGGTPPPDPSHFDLYGGGAYFHPFNSQINNFFYQPIYPGAVGSATAYFSRHFGVQAEGSYFSNGGNNCVYTAQAGPVFRLQKNRWVPFVHVLGGGAKVGGPSLQPCTWGWGGTAGAGLDYVLPLWNNHLAIRPIQGDFEYSRVDYGTSQFTTQGGIGTVRAYRLSAGVVLRLGGAATRPALQLGCTAQPVDIFPGDPVVVTAISSNLDIHRKTTYTWSSSGGSVAPADTIATISTAGLAAGDYAITGHVSQGTIPREQAECTAGFRVHAYEVPTLSCSANPATVQAGGMTTITAVSQSPQNRPLSYSYSASAGQITGSTETATLNTAGATPGSTITVTCNAVDDLGQQATATTSVGISVPPAPPAPLPQPLCSVTFDRSKKHPVRVDNEAKGCLDDIALLLNRDSGAKLVIVGHHSNDETPDAAAERTLNVEQYLVDEKGIDPAHIELRTSGYSGRFVENTLVPNGAEYDESATAPFDVNSIHRHGQPYGKPKSRKTPR